MNLLERLLGQASEKLEPVLDAIERHRPACIKPSPSALFLSNCTALDIRPADVACGVGHLDVDALDLVGMRLMRQSYETLSDTIKRRRNFVGESTRYHRSLKHAYAYLVFSEYMSEVFLGEARWPSEMHPYVYGLLGQDPWTEDLLAMRGVSTSSVFGEADQRGVLDLQPEPGLLIPALVPEVGAHQAATIVGVSHSRICRAVKERQIKGRHEGRTRRLYCELPSVLSYKRKRERP
jgi:hypothetical protein